jgi:uncharacterized protein YbjQ (UPF0145 family)
MWINNSFRYAYPKNIREFAMLITTQDELSGFQIVDYKGIVRGSTVRTRHIGKDILAALRNLVGGEVSEYTKLLAEAREQAMDRMIDHANSLGANGIVCIRYTTSSVASNAAELFVYGTAVVLEKVV